MTHIITSLCLRDGGCIEVCPVECIIPGKPESEWPWMYIDPDTCIDCGACIPECPYEAIFTEDETPIWLSEKPGELYPYRVRTEPDIILSTGETLPAEGVVADLEYTKRWPPEHWTLAFQGNVHILNERDYEHLRSLIAARAALAPA